MTKKRILLIVAALLVAGGAGAYIPIKNAQEQKIVDERFQGHLGRLENGTPRLVSDTVTAIEAEERFLNARARVLELAETVANRELLDDLQSLQSSQKFWKLMQNAEPLREHELLPEALAKIRHNGLLVNSRAGTLELYYNSDTGK